MLSLTVTTHKPISLFSNHPSSFLSPAFLSHHPHPFTHPPSHKPPLAKPISATITPSSSPPNPSQQLYQPFRRIRPPPPPLPAQFRSLDTDGRLEILADRLGLWFEYAPLIPALTQEGFSASTLEDFTGISGIEQNLLVVASQVRESLIQSETDPDTLSFFDTGGAELLYEIRLLSASQRATTARYLVENKLDTKGVQELARAMKDFPRRRGESGWESFNYALPGDCLSFVHYRQAQEHKAPSEQRTAALQRALQVVVSEGAKKRILEDLEGGDCDGKAEGGVEDGVRVPVGRMKVSEVAEATSVVVFPVYGAEERDRELEEVP